MVMSWKKHVRTDARRAAGREFVSFRPMGIAFSAEFIEKHELGGKDRVSLLVDEQQRRLGFQFHKDAKDADSYALSSDGGLSKGRWFQSRSVYTDYPWVKKILSKPSAARRLPVKKGDKSIFYVEVPDES
jgi:hypothetical protein